MRNVGLYPLSRGASTLSGGEAQRIRLATQIGSRLTGVIYILDEPSIGLHPRDNSKLLDTLVALRDLGNTVVVIEHDKETMLSADHLIDIGPGAGVHGGKIVSQGTPSQVCADRSSLTGAYLSGRREIPLPATRRKGNGSFLTLKGASGNNLKNISHISLECWLSPQGIGSGKSSLVNQTLYPALAKIIYRSKTHPLPFQKITGLEHIDIVISTSPLSAASTFQSCDLYQDNGSDQKPFRIIAGK